ncbi:MAG: undecaprenyl-phosphate glucose phosphotransferase [Hyphomicrobium sp.]|nr:undecaprenyl-phosphate glucose phosphotransferase [Hyphomicrobium sp.]
MSQNARTLPAADGPAPAAINILSVPRLADTWLPGRQSLVSARVLSGAVRLLDAALAIAAGLLTGLLYVSAPILTRDWDYAIVLAFAGVLTVGVLQALGLYRSDKFASPIAQLPRIAAGWTLTLGLVAVSLVLFKMAAEFSRVWLAMWLLTGGVALMAGRLAVAHTVRALAQDGRLYRRAVIYGAGPVSEDVIRQLERDAGLDIRISGIFDDRSDAQRAPRLIAGYPRLGGIEDLIQLGRDSRIDLVIVALPIAGEARLSHIITRLSVLPVDIKLPARATAIRFSPKTYSHVGSVAMIDLYDKPITDWGVVSKWLFDKAFALAALVALAPVMAAVALAVRLDSRGPIFFRQKRYGFNNEMIEVLKFRSMYVDRCDAAAAKLVTKDDPRVTPVGRFIRKTSLDELPQLLNVLTGQLSLVGPRPHAVAAKAEDRLYQDVVDGYFARHKVKPGITGWAQIHGWRGETDTREKIEKRVEHDLYYIENWSVLLDLYILFRTPLSLLKTENAY